MIEIAEKTASDTEIFYKICLYTQIKICTSKLIKLKQRICDYCWPIFWIQRK